MASLLCLISTGAHLRPAPEIFLMMVMASSVFDKRGLARMRRTGALRCVTLRGMFNVAAALLLNALMHEFYRYFG